METKLCPYCGSSQVVFDYATSGQIDYATSGQICQSCGGWFS